MFCRSKKLSTPEEYGFPYQPYEIQQKLMKSLYEVIENSEIGIFESPTGTGKSLTLSCAAIRWLVDHEQASRIEMLSRIADLMKEIAELDRVSTITSDWLESQLKVFNCKDQLRKEQLLQKKIEKYTAHLETLKEIKGAVKSKKKIVDNKSNDELNPSTESHEETEFLLEHSSNSIKPTDHEEIELQNTKVIICSRTHTQLSQLVSEIKKSKISQNIRCISLASRQSLCINPEVNQLSNATLINEKCLELQRADISPATEEDGRLCKKSRFTNTKKCPFKTSQAVAEMSATNLFEIRDIEDLVTSGKSLKACPYYAARNAVKDAQVVLVPYQMVLHRRTREQIGIDLKNNVLLIDEAHNLLDTISSIYSAEICKENLNVAQKQLTNYKNKYLARLSTNNLLKINQILFIMKRLLQIMDPKDLGTKFRVLSPLDLISECDFFNLNMPEILQFAEATKIAQRLHGLDISLLVDRVVKSNDRGTVVNEFTSSTQSFLRDLEVKNMPSYTKECDKKAFSENKYIAVEATCAAPDNDKSTGSPIRQLFSLIELITECSTEGKIVINYEADPKLAKIKFLLLDSGGHFEDIVKDARSIVIAGGTMKPTEEIIMQLFKSCIHRVKEFSYDHIVPKESVFAVGVRNSPSGIKFRFDYSNRNNLMQLTDLGNAIITICNIVPSGIVCFLGSYDFLDVVYKHFAKYGVLDKILKKKEIFREPKTVFSSTSIEVMLEKYSKAAYNQGAILFGVVGGKLSEGLNFSDDLGRCVILVGMPFPNKNSVELKEKMHYLENSTLGAGSGTEYYENLCMKAVNQCIGRSVRHINDYASVLLLDDRYSQDNVKRKLPVWMLKSFQVSETFDEMQKNLQTFFRLRTKFNAPLSSV